MRTLLFVKLIVVLLTASGLVMGQQSMDALEQLQNVLEQETRLATKTKLNIDFVPGMVSVLEGHDLRAKGYERVFDALAAVPGIELSSTGDGQWQVMVRGVGKSFASAKVKILLNGIAFNGNLNAVSTALVIPVRMVDRIEVIRGPGSALYGEFASVGVINIVTRKQAEEVFVDHGTDDSYTISGQSHQELANGLLMNFSFAEYARKSGNISSGEDLFASSPFAPFNAASLSPGYVNDSEHHKSFLVSADWSGFNLNWQFVQRSFGDYFGMADVLSGDTGVNRSVAMHGVDLGKVHQLGSDLQSSFNGGWIEYSIRSRDLLLFPSGTVFPWGAAFPDGVVASPNYKESTYYGGVELNYDGLAQHQILLGLRLSKTSQGETYAQRNYNLNAMGMIVNAPYQRYTGSENWIEEGLSRRSISAYLQDQLSLGEQLRITAGVRVDDYDDVGSEVLPRIAFVFQPRDHQTVKLQYARSFRPPTFMEMHVKNNAVVTGNPDLKSELFNNYELAYVFNNGMRVLRTTAYYFVLKNRIVVDSVSKTYINQGEIHSKGVELAYKSKIAQDYQFDAGMSYSSSRSDAGEPMPGSANWNTNLGLIASNWPSTTASAVLSVVGARKRQVGDNRDDLKPSKVLDLTVKTDNVLSSKASVSLIVKISSMRT